MTSGQQKAIDAAFAAHREHCERSGCEPCQGWWVSAYDDPRRPELCPVGQRLESAFELAMLAGSVSNN